MNLKEFFEKRWWNGVGAAAGIAAIVLGNLQYRGISISWVHISIAASIVLGIALAIVASQSRKWQRKYEDVSSQLKEVEEFFEKQRKEQAQTKKRKIILLPDPNTIWKLNIDNPLLTKLHGQAHGLATTKFHDAKLSNFDILIYPYCEDDRASILFGFYCGLADRVCTFIIGEWGDWHESLPTKPVTHEIGRITFDELPWISSPNWPQFLRHSCEKTGPLSPARWTVCHISTRPYREQQWSISFKDGISGEEHRFSWDGKGDPISRD